MVIDEYDEDEMEQLDRLQLYFEINQTNWLTYNMID